MGKAPYEACALELAPGIRAVARMRRGNGRALLVILRGAVNQKKQPAPAFRLFLREFPELDQLSVADPVLDRFANLSAGWYLGWKGERLWQGLSDAVKARAAELGVERVLYLGSSVGGFAAPVTRGIYFEPDGRNVSPYGVEMVMRHFFSGRLGPHFGSGPAEVGEEEIICDEEAMLRAVE